MNTQNHERQRQATIAVAQRHRANARGDEPPRVGDTFLCRQTSDYPVEWLVIHENDGQRFQVVPLDVHPFVGSRDIERTDATGVVRCDLDVWLNANDLLPPLRTGVLTDAEMNAVRNRRQSIADETLVPTLREEEVDTDPEYVLWRESTLQPALATLTPNKLAHSFLRPPLRPPLPGHSRSGTAQQSTGERAGVRGRVNVWQRVRPYLATAASLVLAVTFAVRFQNANRQLLDERQQRTTLEERHQSQAQTLNATVQENEHLQTQLQEQRQASDEALTAQQNAFDERLTQIADNSIVANVPSFVLSTDEIRRASRGLSEVIHVGNAPRFTLSLEAPQIEQPFHGYRLRLLKKESERYREIWSNAELRPQNGKWLRLDLPTDLFELGTDYELRLDGLTVQGPKPLDERYLIQVNR